MSKIIPAVVLGATGYVGGELLRLLSEHPNFELVAAVSNSRNGYPIAVTFPNLASAFGRQCFVSHDQWSDKIEAGSQVAVFSAAPHGSSASVILSALETAATKNLLVHVVDSSADFRFADRSDYESVYATKHGAPDLLAEFASGVPEHVADIRASHIGHPGCFATAVLLAAVPLSKSKLTEDEIFVTGITGSTGSGRTPTAGTHHPERHGNLYAYKPLSHRHAPEMESLTKAASGREMKINFVPHSGPFARGIYATVQAKVSAPIDVDQLRTVYEDAYAEAPFVEVIDGTPRMKNVVASNRCQIGVAANDDTIVVVSAIDNLVKGAAGGAVQWMNRLWGLPETAGLTAAAPGWT
jgi:N-acetyl-gamma-glutamyl-phosphate reductase